MCVICDFETSMPAQFGNTDDIAKKVIVGIPPRRLYSSYLLIINRSNHYGY